MSIYEDILASKVQQFIKENYKKDIPSLVLKGSPFSHIPIEELLQQIESKRKAEKKLPYWFSNDGIVYPKKISLEQCSSESTAEYKASIVSGNSLIDVTGGFGIDTYYFSKQFKEVTYCEINEELAAVVEHNLKQLKVDNVSIKATNGIRYLKEVDEPFDVLFVDPSRRDDVKGKVFLLKDCVPYLPPKIPFLLSKAKTLLIKVSPLLDLSQTIKELQFVSEIHIVAVNNEVKELLFVVTKDSDAAIQIQTVNFQHGTVQQFGFEYGESPYSNYEMPQRYLYEPNAAVLKSGGFHHLTHTYEVFKLQEHSHLYTSETLLDFPGRAFEIDAVFPYDKKKITKHLEERKANITTRNFPKSVAQIRKELKLKDGGKIYLFFTKNMKQKLICLVCKKL
ncbi:MAG: class I SAM-dependent methyltransferase [Polaribacter sp.]